jgi:hypothetical protein
MNEYLYVYILYAIIFISWDPGRQTGTAAVCCNIYCDSQRVTVLHHYAQSKARGEMCRNVNGVICTESPAVLKEVTKNRETSYVSLDSLIYCCSYDISVHWP